MQTEQVQSMEEDALILEGRLTVERTHELREAMLDALNRKDEIIIVLANMTEVDLSFLQLLCSTHKSALQMNKKLTLKGNGAAVLKTAVCQAGYIRTMGCHGDPNRKCLWTGGWEQ